MPPQVRTEQHMRPITRPPPGDPNPRGSIRGSVSSTANPRQSRRQSWFEVNFNERSMDSIKQQVQSEAMVAAEVRTNVIIKDEFTFITDLSYQLAERYQRPITSIAVVVQHGACMLYGGTFDPAYILNITTLEAALSPAVNKRNAALLQGHLEDSLGVTPARGLINFIGLSSDCAATNGKTVTGIQDEAQRASVASGATPAASRPGTSGTSAGGGGGGNERRKSHRLSVSNLAQLARRYSSRRSAPGRDPAASAPLLLEKASR